MIQRIQSVWLLLAALVAALLFYFDYYHLPGSNLSISNNYLAIVLTGLSVLLSLYTLFSYKKRPLQSKLIWLNLLDNVALLAWLFVSINNAKGSIATAMDEGSFWIGSFIPVITIILLFMARAGIRKDEKLVRSLDRLR